jgi:hypothetical protein
MKEISRDEVLNLPNTLLLDPATGRAAAYNATHRLITNNASTALVRYAIAKGYKSAQWDEEKQDKTGMWHPLPPWAAPEVLQRCVLYWLRRGNETASELHEMPRD